MARGSGGSSLWYSGSTTLAYGEAAHFVEWWSWVTHSWEADRGREEIGVPVLPCNPETSRRLHLLQASPTDQELPAGTRPSALSFGMCLRAKPQWLSWDLFFPFFIVAKYINHKAYHLDYF